MPMEKAGSSIAGEASAIDSVCDAFGLGSVLSYEQLKNGNINRTYRVTAGGNGREYILQKLNPAVFKNPEINVGNHAVITAHLRSKLASDPDVERKTVSLYKTADGGYLHKNSAGSMWRAMNYIGGSVTFDKPTADIMRKTGEAFGRFQSLLSDCPPRLLQETLPDFHNTEKRMQALKLSAERDSFGRLREVGDLVSFFLSFPEYASYIRASHDRGDIPVRITHNDTKCNNVMFDKATLEPLAIIDLDTVMPGFSAHDFGDALRFGANTATEDEDDIGKVSFDMDIFRAFTDGYIPEVRESFGKRELLALPYGVTAMTLECGMRFLTDYLDGDVYFITRKNKHNLCRARVQAALLESEIEVFDDMKAYLGALV